MAGSIGSVRFGGGGPGAVGPAVTVTNPAPVLVGPSLTIHYGYTHTELLPMQSLRVTVGRSDGGVAPNGTEFFFDSGWMQQTLASGGNSTFTFNVANTAVPTDTGLGSADPTLHLDVRVWGSPSATPDAAGIWAIADTGAFDLQWGVCQLAWLVQPANVVNTPQVAFSWVFTSTRGFTQGTYEATLSAPDGSQVFFDTNVVTSTVNNLTPLLYNLQPDVSYMVTLTVTNSNGIVARSITATFVASLENLNPAVTGGPLRRFLGLIGYQLDTYRSLAEQLRYLNDPLRCPGPFLPALAQELGVSYEADMGMAQTRKLLATIVHQYKIKGTAPGVVGISTAVTGWEAALAIGPNRLLIGPVAFSTTALPAYVSTAAVPTTATGAVGTIPGYVGANKPAAWPGALPAATTIPAQAFWGTGAGTSTMTWTSSQPGLTIATGVPIAAVGSGPTTVSVTGTGTPSGFQSGGVLQPANVDDVIAVSALVDATYATDGPPTIGVLGQDGTVVGVTGSTPTNPTNLLSAEDTSFEAGTVGSYLGAGNATVSNSTVAALDGTHALGITAVAALLGVTAVQSVQYPIQPNTTYMGLASFRPLSGPVRRVVVSVRTMTATGAFLSDHMPLEVPETPTGWVQSVGTFTSEPTAAFASVWLIVYDMGSANESHLVDRVALYPATAVRRLSGSWAVPAGTTSIQPVWNTNNCTIASGQRLTFSQLSATRNGIPIPFLPAQVSTAVRVYVAGLTAVPTLTLSLFFANAVGAVVSTVAGAATSVAQGAWLQLTVNGAVAPPTAVYAYWQVSGSVAWATGAIAVLAAPQLEFDATIAAWAPPRDLRITLVADRTNLITNPSFEGTTGSPGSAAGWAGTNATIGAVAGTAYQGAGTNPGTYSLRVTAVAAGTMTVVSPPFNLIPGLLYTGSAYVRSAATARLVQMQLLVYDVTGALLTTINPPPPVPPALPLSELPGTSWNRASVQVDPLAPLLATADHGTLQVSWLVVPAGESHYLDAVMAEEGWALQPYFDASIHRGAGDPASPNYLWGTPATNSGPSYYYNNKVSKLTRLQAVLTGRPNQAVGIQSPLTVTGFVPIGSTYTLVIPQPV